MLNAVHSVVQVEPLVTARAVRGPFDYAHPGGDIDVGTLLEVSFGRQRVRAAGELLGVARHARQRLGAGRS